jgi:RNA polymerase sigma-70 factor (ECF subfamily)
MNASNDSLIQRLIAGSASAFDDVVAWYCDDVLRLCYFLLRDKHEAEDVVQEAMLRLVQKIKTKGLRAQNGSIQGFLTRCARNLCIDRLRKSKRMRNIQYENEDYNEWLSHSNTPDKHTEHTRLQTAFDHALNQLPEQHRIILVLFELNGESYKEIAATLNISVETVKKNLYRARKIIREELAPYRDIA